MIHTAQTQTQGLPFLKGHGAQNDFVIIPDPDGQVELSERAVALLCDRRAGIGTDGVLHVVRSAAHPEAAAMAGEAEWFMEASPSSNGLVRGAGVAVGRGVLVLVAGGSLRS